MGVGFDAPRQNMLAGSVNSSASFDVQCARLGNYGDPAVLHPYIQLRRTLGRNYSAAANDQVQHSQPPLQVQ